MLLASAHKKRLAQKVGHLGSLEWIPMIQVLFNSSCVTLQYKTGTKFSIERFQSYTLLKIVQNYFSVYVYIQTNDINSTSLLAIKGHLEVLLKGCWSFHNQSPIPSSQLWLTECTLPILSDSWSLDHHLLCTCMGSGWERERGRERREWGWWSTRVLATSQLQVYARGF